VYSNVSIPGTGISSRQRLDASGQSHGVGAPGVAPAYAPSEAPVTPVAASSTTTEMRSSSTELLNSQNMEELRRLLNEAYNERSTLTSEVESAEREANFARKRYTSWESGFLFKRIFKNAFAVRKQAVETADAKLEELREQLRLTSLATQIEIDRSQAEPYYRMRDEFAALSECKKIWDTLERRAINRAAERSAASEAITREPVSFALSSCDLIQWEQKIPHLANRNGGDLYLYPGFVLYRASRQAFALIDAEEIKLDFRTVRFIEEESVPSETQVVGQTWAKVNKDGSPDRRFRDNYQIPVVLYGTLTFRSSSGLQEEYQFSSATLAERFAKAWAAFQNSYSPSNGGSK